MVFVGKQEYARSFRDREELFPLEGKKFFGWGWIESNMEAKITLEATSSRLDRLFICIPYGELVRLPAASTFWRYVDSLKINQANSILRVSRVSRERAWLLCRPRYPQDLEVASIRVPP
jgi:hypothetical protein